LASLVADELARAAHSDAFRKRDAFEIIAQLSDIAARASRGRSTAAPAKTLAWLPRVLAGRHGSAGARIAKPRATRTTAGGS